MEIQPFLIGMADVLEMSPAEINEQTVLIPDRWDSIAILGAIALIDEQFGVTVPTTELRKCTSLKAVIELVRRTQAEAVASESR